MSRKRSLENPVEIRNEIDGEWMNRNFKIDDEWYWIPLHAVEMSRSLTRESTLIERDYDKLRVKSCYKINVLTGRIFSSLNNRIIRETIDATYTRINLFLNKHNTIFRVHVLVCLMAHGLRPTSEHTVDHTNRVRTDNAVNNLRYASLSLQSKNRIRTNDWQGESIDSFVDHEYTLVKYICTSKGTVEFKPYRNVQTIHLSNTGKNVVVNKCMLKRIYISSSYPAISVNGYSVKLHRLMYLNHHNKKSVEVVDHIDGDKLNWAIENLRECTRSQNTLYAHREQHAIINTRITIENILTGDKHELRSKQQLIYQFNLKPFQARFVYEGFTFGNYRVLSVKSKPNSYGGKRRPVICNGQRFDSIRECCIYINSIHPETPISGVYTNIRMYILKGLPYKEFSIQFDDSAQD